MFFSLIFWLYKIIIFVWPAEGAFKIVASIWKSILKLICFLLIWYLNLFSGGQLEKGLEQFSRQNLWYIQSHENQQRASKSESEIVNCWLCALHQFERCKSERKPFKFYHQTVFYALVINVERHHARFNFNNLWNKQRKRILCFKDFSCCIDWFYFSLFDT